VLTPEQRPKLSFIPSPEYFRPVTPSGMPAKVVVNTPLDFLRHLPGIVTPDTDYKLLSKHELALSGLPTAPSEMLRTSLTPADA